ncbi:fluoride efflux transporter CrcB [Acetobacter fabarum]|uniref:Fluoride-specific ion channel FluC n=13 Tax=Acetobacteraceae TaxID=433 RepID=FLUC_GLUOX|nr:MULTISPECIES: fluoride efflux transporter CrcB [Acetobacteraceae]Q5HXN6.1 RecName: Full=Fluoride-specific ion channel FluC [Gluconobacter oxydans 621H]GBR34978.1 integral membrane protein CrcB [Komagataeibacter oboediens DSM 11826]AAW59717.1 Integral membrane protein [Gluconobacter oxydans 621H]AOW48022.1 camphor resistance protein CrcB [Acetobacter ascendens]AOX18372.1 camphor resistance protein CrcB [Kozakia baliensis]KON63047.1 putative fluoride ion transporter CrcB [Komagataeibacter eu
MSFTTCLIVMVGGALGTLARYLVSVAAMPISRFIPWGTILPINALGSFVIGFFGTLTLADGRYPVSENMRLFVMIGLCGGYTTFSSFSLQTLDLIRNDAWGRASVNVAASVILCIGAVALGHITADGFNTGAIRIAQTATEEDA